MKKIIFAFALLLFAHQTLIAWSGPGHMTLAAIAYRELSSNDMQRVSELLRHHPDYAKWTNSFEHDLTPYDLKSYVFTRASKWPDETGARAIHTIIPIGTS